MTNYQGNLFYPQIWCYFFQGFLVSKMTISKHFLLRLQLMKNISSSNVAQCLNVFLVVFIISLFYTVLSAKTYQNPIDYSRQTRSVASNATKFSFDDPLDDVDEDLPISFSFRIPKNETKKEQHLHDRSEDEMEDQWSRMGFALPPKFPRERFPKFPDLEIFEFHPTIDSNNGEGSSKSGKQVEEKIHRVWTISEDQKSIVYEDDPFTEIIHMEVSVNKTYLPPEPVSLCFKTISRDCQKGSQKISCITV